MRQIIRMTLLAVLMTAFITSAQAQDAPTPIPTIPPTAAPPGTVASGEVRYAKALSVRSGPFLGASRLDIIWPGTSYPVFAQNTAEGEYTWYLIQVQRTVTILDQNTQQTVTVPDGDPVRGWVSGRYFFLAGSNAVVPTQGTVFETLTAPPSTGVGGQLRSNMRLREGASYRTPTLQILDFGAEVEILGRTLQAGESHWFLVNYEGQVGWLYAPFIAVYDDIERVPVY